MKTWEEMEPRERDVWIAEHVMGYVRYKGYDTVNGERIEDCAYQLLCTPEYRDRWAKKFGPSNALVPDVEPVPCDIPSFSADASADYEVLTEVREAWSDEDFDRFSAHVEGTCAARATVDERLRLDNIALVLKYLQKGDYSHAAYLTITENGE